MCWRGISTSNLPRLVSAPTILLMFLHLRRKSSADLVRLQSFIGSVAAALADSIRLRTLLTLREETVRLTRYPRQKVWYQCKKGKNTFICPTATSINFCNWACSKWLTRWKPKSFPHLDSQRRFINKSHLVPGQVSTDKSLDLCRAFIFCVQFPSTRFL